MPTVPLPSDPSLVQLRKQVRELQRRLRSGERDALDLLAEYVPGTVIVDSTAIPLHLAALVTARRYAFRSWTRLVRHLEVVRDFSRTPDVDPPDSHPIEGFLRHAVLRYGTDDGPPRWAIARQLLAADPSIGPANIYTASATADHAAVQQFLLADRRSANRAGGPLNWEPLLYLAYARHRSDVAVADVITTAGLLLQSGADPNAGFLWKGLTPAFTVLTGVFGSGEQSVSSAPHHPHALVLARLLLEAGADPNDGQALYNRMFEPDNSHLELLFDFGLGSGDGGPWHRRMPEVTQSPTQLVRAQLNWAVSHAMVDRIRLLAAHHVDLDSPFDHSHLGSRSKTPTELALISGLPQIARLLADLGARPAAIDDRTRLVGALLSGDADQVESLVASAPDLPTKVRRRHPSLILRACVARSRAGVELLLHNGFDVNAFGRQDIPLEQEWETALHHAAGEGDLEFADLLLRAGADPNLRDRRFEATPLGWAENFEHTDMVELLRPLTVPS